MLMPSIFGENLFDDWMSFPVFRGYNDNERKMLGSNGLQCMKTDVHELEGGYELDIEIPGYKKEDLNLSLEKGYLTVTANKDVNNDEKNEEGKIIRQERYSGSMKRSFYVGDHVTEEDVKAKFEDGILKLSVPKKEAKPLPEKKLIMIEG